MRVLLPLPDHDFDVGQLGAAPEARAFYGELTRAPEFAATVAWDSVEVSGFDGLLLAGGHAPGMRQYLGSAVLQSQVARFWQSGRPVGAICHEVRASLDNPREQFQRGPFTLSERGTATDDSAAYVIQDGNYLSARWPGDAYLFGRRFRDLLGSAS